MRSSAFRLYRQQLLSVPRRFASSTASSTAQSASNATNNAAATASANAAKAKEHAAQFAGKAAEALGKAGEKFVKVAAQTEGRTGQLLRTIETTIPKAIYYGKVGLELSRLVFNGQKMSPPDLATFQSVLRPLLNPAHVANLARSAIVSVRSVSSKEVAAYGVLGAEILGFFTVGEIIGRRKLVGYRGNAPAQH